MAFFIDVTKLVLAEFRVESAQMEFLMGHPAQARNSHSAATATVHSIHNKNSTKKNKRTREFGPREVVVSIVENDYNNSPMGEEIETVTVRGTPRIRRKMRSPSEIGGDPQAECNRYDAKIGGRVSKELRNLFVERANSLGMKQGEALEVALNCFLEITDESKPHPPAVK